MGVMKLKSAVLLPLVCCAAIAQSTTPPPIVRIVTTRGLQYSGIYANATVDVIGMRASTGPAQTWWIEMHASFASVEANGNRFGGDDSRAMIGVLEPGLSYLAEEAMRVLPRAHYIRVTIYRMHPGTETEFASVVNVRRRANVRVNAARADLLYHVVSGDDAGTYIVLSPLASLSALDEGPADPPPGDVLPREAEIELSREHYLFSVEPRLSHVSNDFANGDPHFWRP